MNEWIDVEGRHTDRWVKIKRERLGQMDEVIRHKLCKQEVIRNRKYNCK